LAGRGQYSRPRSCCCWRHSRLAFVPGMPTLELPPQGGCCWLGLARPDLFGQRRDELGGAEFKSTIAPIIRFAVGCVIFTAFAVAPPRAFYLIGLHGMSASCVGRHRRPPTQVGAARHARQARAFRAHHVVGGSAGGEGWANELPTAADFSSASRWGGDPGAARFRCRGDRHFHSDRGSAGILFGQARFGGWGYRPAARHWGRAIPAGRRIFNAVADHTLHRLTGGLGGNVRRAPGVIATWGLRGST